jgi:hypothetical protein
MQKSNLAVCLGAAALPAVAQSCKAASVLAQSLSRNVTVVSFTPQACINQEMTMKTRIESVNKSEGNSPARQARESGAQDSATGNEVLPREQWIAEAAYFRAEQRGFAPGNELSDWLDAEADVERMLESDPAASSIT